MKKHPVYWENIKDFFENIFVVVFVLGGIVFWSLAIVKIAIWLIDSWL